MKAKSHKSLIKRIKETKTGKLVRRKMSAQHLVSGKSRRAIKTSGNRVEVSSSNTKRLKELL